jgi:hypothetical protein
MKRLALLHTLCVLAFIISMGYFTSGVSAHAGGPPYVKVNGDYALTNPILNTSQPSFFSVGLDMASSSGIIIGDTVTFEVDEQFFPNPYVQAQSPFGLPVVNQAPSIAPIFRWDFKDGTEKKEGVKVTHVFNTAGTYIVDLEAKFPGKTEDFSSVDTIQMTVAPSREYVLPVGKIKINGQMVEDPLRDTIAIKPAVPISLDGSSSVGKITKYIWDFGDGKGIEKQKATHRYSRDEYFPVVALRVIDENNIIHDTYALLDMPIEKSNPVLSIYYAVVDFITGLFYRE